MKVIETARAWHVYYTVPSNETNVYQFYPLAETSGAALLIQNHEPIKAIFLKRVFPSYTVIRRLAQLMQDHWRSGTFQ